MFLYFLPRMTREEFEKAPRRTLADFGLSGVFADLFADPSRIGMRGASRGPDGFDGLIVFAPPVGGTLPADLGFHPDRQEWRKIGDEGGYYLGFSKVDGIAPDSLRRIDQVSGFEHQLGDGALWNCPILRRASGATNLPTAWGADARTGQFSAHILPGYAELWPLAERLWALCLGGVDATIAELFPIVVSLVGVNYRIGPHEATALSLFNSQNAMDVVQSAVDWPTFEELVARDADSKKKACPSEPVSASPGSTDC